jgi:hypothetical protein
VRACPVGVGVGVLLGRWVDAVLAGAGLCESRADAAVLLPAELCAEAAGLGWSLATPAPAERPDVGSSGFDHAEAGPEAGAWRAGWLSDPPPSRSVLDAAYAAPPTSVAPPTAEITLSARNRPAAVLVAVARLLAGGRDDAGPARMNADRAASSPATSRGRLGARAAASTRESAVPSAMSASRSLSTAEDLGRMRLLMTTSQRRPAARRYWHHVSHLRPLAWPGS